VGQNFHCCSVCLCDFPHDVSKTDAARITKLNTGMFHDESWKPIYFGVRKSKVKVASQKHCRRGSLHSCECWLLLVSDCHHLFAAELVLCDITTSYVVMKF